jgi:hypothetical protein
VVIALRSVLRKAINVYTNSANVSYINEEIPEKKHRNVILREFLRKKISRTQFTPLIYFVALSDP